MAVGLGSGNAMAKAHHCRCCWFSIVPACTIQNGPCAGCLAGSKLALEEGEEAEASPPSPSGRFGLNSLDWQSQVARYFGISWFEGMKISDLLKTCLRFESIFLLFFFYLISNAALFRMVARSLRGLSNGGRKKSRGFVRTLQTRLCLRNLTYIGPG